MKEKKAEEKELLASWSSVSQEFFQKAFGDISDDLARSIDDQVGASHVVLGVGGNRLLWHEHGSNNGMGNPCDSVPCTTAWKSPLVARLLTLQLLGLSSPLNTTPASADSLAIGRDTGKGYICTKALVYWQRQRGLVRVWRARPEAPLHHRRALEAGHNALQRACAPTPSVG
mmetsp:Transcript_53641/g.138189  ORF Transcript_53641/g.138189 Transcript_53641/m.138189 type:complete len:172 (-) Transcript_53641:26-541(-)